MEKTTLSKSTVGFGLSLAIACVLNAFIVIAKEKSEAVMNGMKKITGHHWTTHVLLVLVAFGLIGWLLGLGNRRPAITAGRLIATLVSSVVAAGLLIAGFYLIAG